MSTQTVTLRLVAENGQLIGGLRASRDELGRLGGAAVSSGRQAEQGMAAARRGVQSISQQLARAKAEVVGFFGAFVGLQGARALASTADGYANITAQLRLATRSQSEFSTAQAETFAISQRTSTALDSTANLYARITRSTSELGIEQGRILALTETINQTFAVSGTSAVNQANAITQLTQAFAGGVLRAEEFNSVIENSPRLAQAMADGMGIGMGELRRQVNDGAVDVQRLIGALESQAQTVAEEFSQMPLTIERAWVRIGNAVTRYLGEADQARGVSAGLAQSLAAVASHFAALADAAITTAFAAATVAVARLAGALQAKAAITLQAIAVSRAHSAALAENAAHDVAAAAAKVRNLEATQAAIVAARAEQTARLAKTYTVEAEARATIAATSATGSAGVASGFLRRAEQQLTGAIKARSAATAELALLGRQQASVSAQLTTATAASTAAQTAAASAIAATGIAARAAAVGVAALNGALALVGGPVGAAILAGVGIYYLTTMATDAEKRAAELRGGIDKLRASLSDLNKEAAEQELYAVRDQIREVAAAVADSDRRMSQNVRDHGVRQGGFWAGVANWGTGMSVLKRESDALNGTLGELYKTEGQLVTRLNALTSGTQNYVETISDQTAAEKAREDAVKKANESAAEQIKQLNLQLGYMARGMAADEAAKRAKLELDGVEKTQIDTLIESERRIEAQTEATKRSTEATEAATKAWADYQDELAKRADAYDDALFAVQDEVKLQTELNRLLRSGVSEAQAEAQARRAMEPIQSNAINAERDRLATIQAANRAIVEGRQATAEAAQRAREAAEEQIRRTAEASQRAADEINRSLTDALFRGFEAGKGFARNFFDGLMNTARTMVLRPVIEFVLAPLSGALGSILGGAGGGGGLLGGVGSLFSAGNFAKLGEAFFNKGVLPLADILGNAGFEKLAVSITNLGATLAPALRALPAAGAAFAWFEGVRSMRPRDSAVGSGIYGALGTNVVTAPLVGLDILTGGNVFGGKWKTDDLRLAGTFADGAFDGSLTRYDSKRRSLGRSTRRRNHELDPTEFEDALSELFGEIFAAGTDAAQRLGLSVSDFSYRVDESIMGLEGDALAEKLMDIVSGASDALVQQLLPSAAQYRLENETAAETFFRVAHAATQMGTALERVNQSLDASGERLVEVSQILLDQFGGDLEAFLGSVSGYFDRFFTDAEKFAADRSALDAGFSAQDLGTLSATRAAYRDLVEGLDLTTESGAAAFATLVQLSDVADRYYQTLEQREADRAELLGSITDRIDELSMSAEALDLLRLDREFDALRSRAAELDLDGTIIDQLYALERAARDAGGSVEDLARQRGEFDADIAARLARQGLSGDALETYELDEAYRTAVAEATRLGADLVAVEAYFQGERNRIAAAAAEVALEAERRNAEAIATERAGLERELLQVQGDTVALRALEREALHESNRELYDRIQALRDSQAAEAEAARAIEQAAQAARQQAEQNLETARRNAVTAYDAEIGRLQQLVDAVGAAQQRVNAARSNAVSIYERERSALQATADEFRGFVQSLGDLRRSLLADRLGESAGAELAMENFQQIARRARLGDREALAQFGSAAEAAREAALANAPTREAYVEQLIAIEQAAAEAEAVAGRQVSIAEQQLGHLDAQAARLGLLNDQVQTLDGAVRELQSAQQALAIAESAATQASEQIGLLQAARDGIAGVNTSVLSVAEAVAQLALAQAQYAASIAGGFAQVNSRISSIQAVPQFAAGGIHSGGLRVVGEYGPELELTGASRILSNDQLRAILAGGSGDPSVPAKLDALIARVEQLLLALAVMQGNSDRVAAAVEEWNEEGLPEERAA